MRLISSSLIAAAVIAAFVAGRSTGTLSSQANAQTAGPMATGAMSDGAVAGAALSHFKCYQTSVVRLPQPDLVYLQDQFGTEKMQLVYADMLCAPVVKRPINFKPLAVPGPADHLLCYRGEDKAVNQVRSFANQLQRGRLQVTVPRYLCVPTWKQHLPTKQ